jgi:hypothetical protein
MTDIVIIQPSTNPITITEDVNEVIVSSVGVQGATGATGATGAQGAQGIQGIQGVKGDTGATGAKGDTGATGATGSSGVIAVTAPITNSGTSTSANIGVDAGSTSAAGVLQLTNSTSSTSTTTAATPNAVKTTYDLAYSQFMPFLSGNYYKGTGANLTTAAGATASVTYYTPFFLPVTTTFDRILMRTGTTYSGTATVRMGIYNSTAGLPSTLVLDAGTVSPVATNVSYQITITQQLTPGLYWLAANSQTAATANNYVGIASNQASTFIGQPYSNTTLMTQYYTQTGVTGAFANASGVTAGTGTGGISVWVRAA